MKCIASNDVRSTNRNQEKEGNEKKTATPANRMARQTVGISPVPLGGRGTGTPLDNGDEGVGGTEPGI